MAVQGMQDIIYKYLRCATRWLQAGNEGLAEVMDRRIENPVWPCQPLNPWCAMHIGNFIQSGLSDVYHQRVKGIGDPARGLIL